MASIEFKPMDEARYRTLLSWFDDPLIRRWYGPVSDTWLAYVQNEPGVYAWIVYEWVSLAICRVLIRMNG